jgi:hypothetical protein
MAKPHTPMSRVRVLLIAVSAILAVAACQSTPAEPQTSVDMASANSHASRA